MPHIARIQRTGGPEVIEWVEVDLPEPAANEVRLRSTAIGLNYIDTYHRSGLYPVPLPAVLGSESVGVVEAVGAEVEGFATGDRVGTFGPSRGTYATARNVPGAELVRLPASVDDRTAAALLLKGCTAEFLIERCARVQSGQTVLVTAAAGGVGQLLVGWLRAIGATVIAVVGGEEKVSAVRRAGADHAIDHQRQDIAQEVRRIARDGVPVVLDGVGKATWSAALDSVARRGLIVSFGNASGAIEGVGLGTLSARGSIFVTRPTLFDYAATPEEKQASVNRVFDMLAKGAIRPEIGQTFALKDAAAAHRALEASQTRGATLLLP